MRSHLPETCIGIGTRDALDASWPLYVGGAVFTVRRSSQDDLPAIAMMHNRCSAKSLLDRYRRGGRAPAVVTLDRQLREPLGYVVAGDAGRIVATANVTADSAHRQGCAEIGILVEDAWQRLGIGRTLLRHLAAAAVLSGYHQLIAYPGTATTVVQRLMIGIGTTRMTLDDNDRHLRTSLPQAAALGLGSLRVDGGRAGTPALTST